jgi:hypothetical protein
LAVRIEYPHIIGRIATSSLFQVLWSIIVAVPILVDRVPTLASRVTLTVVLGAFVAVASAMFSSIPVVLGNVDIGRSGRPALTSTGETVTSSITDEIGLSDSGPGRSSQDRLGSSQGAGVTAFFALMQNYKSAFRLGM